MDETQGLQPVMNRPRRARAVPNHLQQALLHVLVLAELALVVAEVVGEEPFIVGAQGVSNRSAAPWRPVATP